MMRLLHGATTYGNPESRSWNVYESRSVPLMIVGEGHWKLEVKYRRAESLAARSASLHYEAVDFDSSP